MVSTHCVTVAYRLLPSGGRAWGNWEMEGMCVANKQVPSEGLPMVSQALFLGTVQRERTTAGSTVGPAFALHF